MSTNSEFVIYLLHKYDENFNYVMEGVCNGSHPKMMLSPNALSNALPY